MLKAIMDTNKGKIELDLFDDKVPYTVASFVNLAQKDFYKGLSFHRVIDEFMVQGGCPLGTGTGGPGYSFEDEFDASLIHDKPGKLSMANSGKNTNGSQFFITHVATPWLDGGHAIFGAVSNDESMDIVNSVVQGDKINNIFIEGDITELFEKTADKLSKWNKALGK